MDEEDKKIAMETLSKEFPDKPELPEAPASTNTRVQLPSGRQYQITMRAKTVKEVCTMIESMESWFDNKGWTVPDWQKDGKKSAKRYPTQSDGTVPFGKHKGKKYSELDDEYLDWMVRETDDPAKSFAQSEVDRRANVNN